MTRHCAAGLLALLLITPAWGESVLHPPAQNLTQAETAERQRFAAEPEAAGVSLVRVDVETLKNAAAGEELTFALKSPQALAIRTREVQQLEDHRVLWIGDLAAKGIAGEALIVIEGDKVTGTIDVPDGGLYELRPAQDGLTALLEVDRSKFPAGNDEVEETSRRGKVPPAPQAPPPGAGRPVIRVLFAYTSAAETWSFGIDNLIALTIADGNEAFRNSGLDMEFQLAGKVHVDYDESGKSFDDIIHHLPDMKEVTSRRDATYASVVVLIAHAWIECGIGNVHADADDAYSVISPFCAVLNHAFAHEVGHNAGARHDIEHDSNDHPYAFGHGFQSFGWHTIMAYPCKPPWSCERKIPYYSNPDVKFEGIATGTENTENVAKVWRLRAGEMAAFRSRELWKKADSAAFSDISCDRRKSEVACFGVTNSDWLFRVSVVGDKTYWSRWAQKAITSAPDCLIGEDRTDCLAADSNGMLIDGTRIGSAPAVWTPLGRKIVGAPECRRTVGGNDIDCFVRQPDGSVAHIARRQNKWGTWDDLGGSITSGLSCTFLGANPFDCFARGANGALMQVSWNESTRWSSWNDRGGKIISRPECLSWGMGRIDCFAQGDPSTGMFHIAADWNKWAGWDDLHGGLAGDIGCTSRAENRLDCFVAGKAPGIHQRSWTGTDWTKWDGLGGLPASPPKCIAPRSDRIYCFLRGTDNALYYKYWDGNAWYPQTAAQLKAGP